MSVADRPVSVLLVEPQAVVAQSLAVLLSGDKAIDVVGHVASAKDVASGGGKKPDVIVLDVDGEPDLEAAVSLCMKASPTSRVCVLSIELRAEPMQRAMTSGAVAYIVKDFAPGSLAHIIRSVMDGDFYADPRLAGTVLRRKGAGREIGTLSRRESDILRLIATGLSNKEIGARLSLSEKTVKNHISHIFVKLNLSGRARAAVYAIQNGLVS